METWDAIRARRNVRSYRTDAVPATDLDRIAEAGWRAPSASNRQHWDFVVVTDPDQLRVPLPQFPDLRGLLLDDLQRPHQQFLSGCSARRRRPCTVRICQNTGHRSHEPQQTPPSPANHAPRPACRSRRPREAPQPPSQDFRRLTGQKP